MDDPSLEGQQFEIISKHNCSVYYSDSFQQAVRTDIHSMMSMGRTMTKALLMFLLLVIRVSSYASLDDPYLREPTHTENRSEHEIIREFIQMKMLEGLGIAKPPAIPSEPTVILKDDVRSLPLSSYQHTKHFDNHGEASSTQTQRRFSRVIVFAEIGSNSPCRVSKRILKTYISASFKLPSDPSLIHRAILQFKTGTEKRNPEAKRRVWICSCATPSNQTNQGPASSSEGKSTISVKMNPMTNFRLLTTQCKQLAVTVEACTSNSIPKSARQGWNYVHLENNWKSLVSGHPGMDRRLLFLLDGKQSILEHARLSLVLEVEKETLRAKRYPLRMKRAEREVEADECRTARKIVDKKDGNIGSSPSSCCRTGFWVDIEQLGWNDWILDPPGFYYYFCAGQCSNGFDSIGKEGAGLDYFKVLNAMIEKHKITSIRPCCAARKTSSLSIVMVTDRNSVNRTLISNIIVDECACIGFS